MRKNRTLLILAVAIPLLCLLMVFAYYLPPIHSRLSGRVSNFRTQIKYALNPPDEAIFVPQEQVSGNPQLPTQTSTPVTPSSSPTVTIAGQRVATTDARRCGQPQTIC